MGVVYRAEDLRLGRQVALKFLPRELAADAGALGRFEREAQAASSLNHPNICTIYGLEECGGQPVMVMELLEGETLEAIIARGPLPVEKAISMAIQMATALDAAHSKGIVHRDLKPGNVLVGPFGLKVLDFGLAKMQRPVVLSLETPAPATQKGSILGTLHYMSPEQVQGKDADASSDIFSFGAVLYEMLAGRRAFEGPNAACVMAAILALDPKPLGRPIPPALELALSRCLAKETGQRWQTARDLTAALECVATPPAPLVGPRLGKPVMLGMACLCLLGLAAALRFLSPMPAPARATSPPPARAAAASLVLPATKPLSNLASTMTFQPGPISRLSVSPDGARIAFIESGHLYVRRLESSEKQLLGEATGVPFWSPDNRAVAAASGNRLMRFDLDGTAPRQLCVVNTVLAGTWGQDGTILIGLVHNGIYRVPATGGELVAVTNLDSSHGETRHLAPRFLPGGQRFLYIRASAQPGRSMLCVGSLQSSERKEIMPVESNVEFVADPVNARRGYLLFTTGSVLSAKTFDLNTLTAGAATVWLGATITSNATLEAALSTADFSAARNALALHTPDRDGGITIVRNWMNRLGEQR
jgi:serine/threonine protein kinase